MVKIKLVDGEWETLESGSKDKESIYVDKNLYQKLQNMKILQKRKWDNVIPIVGAPGSGKSTLAQTCAWITSKGQITLKKSFCLPGEDVLDKIINAKEGTDLIVDEGSLNFGSRDSASKEQKQLTKALDVVRSKRLNIYICCPDYFSLNKYVAIFRSRFLLYVYPSKNFERGRFAYYNPKKKRILYEEGKKKHGSMAKPKPNWRGRFVDFEPFGGEYLKLKDKIMKASMIHGDKKISPVVIKKITQPIYFNLKKKVPELKMNDLSNILNISRQTLSIYNQELKEKSPLVEV